jgi:molybdopterin synthase sulfur carrier subunit
MSKTITVTVKLFAAYQEAYGKSELQLEFPDQTPVVAVLNHILTEHPELEQWRSQTRLGRNFQFVTAETPLNQGDEVVLIPPVSGG